MTRWIAPFRPSWLSEMTSFTPSMARRPLIRSAKPARPAGREGQATADEVLEEARPEGQGLALRGLPVQVFLTWTPSAMDDPSPDGSWPRSLRESDRWPPGLRWTDVQADDVAPPVGVGCHGDDRRDGDPGVPAAARRLGVGRSYRPREPSGRWRRAAGVPMQPAAWGGQRYGQSPSSCRLGNAPTRSPTPRR